MNGYLYSLAMISVVIALCCTILPASVAKHAKLLCSLCVICILCVPVIELTDSLAQGEWEVPELFEDSFEQEADNEQSYDNLAQDLLVGQLQVLLERDQGLQAEQCRIYVEWSEEGTVEQVSLLLSGKAIWRDPAPIKAYVEQLLGCACTVILD